MRFSRRLKKTRTAAKSRGVILDKPNMLDKSQVFRLLFVKRGKCGVSFRHETQSFGTSEASVRRCLALMREECPNGENNFYIAEDE